MEAPSVAAPAPLPPLLSWLAMAAVARAALKTRCAAS